MTPVFFTILINAGVEILGSTSLFFASSITTFNTVNRLAMPSTRALVSTGAT